MLTVLQGLNFILFAFTAAGVVPCSSPEKYPRLSSKVQIHFLINVFVHFGFIWKILVFVLTILLKVAQLQCFSLVPFCQIQRVTEDA